MLSEALSLSELVLKVLPSLRITKKNRAKIAKLFTSLYRDLELLVENGDRILEMMSRCEEDHSFPGEITYERMREQGVILDRIISLLRRSDIRTIFSLRARQLLPLEGDFALKRFLLLVEEYKDDANLSIKEDLLPRCQKNLHQIRGKLNELRDFIVANFEIHEVM